MTDVIAKVQRELPDTDRTRYDIAYERGRVQARSQMLFLGLVVGAVLGAVAMFILDPARGTARRHEVVRQITGRRNDLSRVVGGRLKDTRNRLTGAAIESGVVSPPEEHGEATERPTHDAADDATEPVEERPAAEEQAAEEQAAGAPPREPEVVWGR